MGAPRDISTSVSNKDRVYFGLTTSLCAHDRWYMHVYGTHTMIRPKWSNVCRMRVSMWDEHVCVSNVAWMCTRGRVCVTTREREKEREYIQEIRLTWELCSRVYQCTFYKCEALRLAFVCESSQGSFLSDTFLWFWPEELYSWFFDYFG